MVAWASGGVNPWIEANRSAADILVGMDEAIETFETRYRTLAVTTCEWRAFELADPEVLADRVFVSLRSRRGAPALRSFYRCVEDVVAKAYVDASAQNSMFAGMMRGQFGSFLSRHVKTDEELARDALASLRAREVVVLRQAVWDGLTPEEMAQVNGGAPEAQVARLESALQHYALKLPPPLGTDPRATLESIHPGTHRR